MSEFNKLLDSLSYKKALKLTESIEAPSVGFAKPSEAKTAFEGQRALIKQNNTLLLLILDLQQQLQDIKEQIHSLKRQQAPTEVPPSKELEVSIDNLTKRLGGLNLGADPIIPRKKGSILVFWNPSDILRSEKDK